MSSRKPWSRRFPTACPPARPAWSAENAGLVPPACPGENRRRPAQREEAVINVAPASHQIDPAAVSELARGFRGELIGPEHSGYQLARSVWNGSVDRHPALVARCSELSDVIAAVGFARRAG